MPLGHSTYSITTADGVNGLMIDVPGASVVHYEIHFRAGYHAVPDGTVPQTAHVLEHMVYGWVDDPLYPTKKAFLDDLYENGAYANASTHYSGSWHWGDNAVSEWERVIGLRRLALTQPLFADAALSSERGNAKDEMRSNVSNYERLSSEYSRMNLGFASQDSTEKISSIDAITREDVRDFYERSYTKANMRFIVAGDFSGDTEKVQKVFTGWNLAAGTRIVPLTFELVRGGSVRYETVEAIPNIFFNLNMVIGRRLTVLEQRMVDILNARLFNVQNAAVFEEARRLGICYRMYARTDMNVASVSMWQISFPVAPENLSQMLRLVVDGLRDVIENGLSDSDYTAALRYTTGKFTQKGQTVSELSDMYFSSYFDDDIIDGSIAASDDSAFEGITADAIIRIAREFLSSDSWTVTGVGKGSEGQFKADIDGLLNFLKANTL